MTSADSEARGAGEPDPDAASQDPGASPPGTRSDRRTRNQGPAEAKEGEHGAIVSVPRLSMFADRAQRWVDENRTLALLGAFAVGVFLGAVMAERDDG